MKDTFFWPQQLSYLSTSAGAKWSREILSRVLIEAYDNGDMPIDEALAAADGILGRNALDFYKLEGMVGFSASTDSLSRLNAGSTNSLASMERAQSFAPRLPPSISTLPPRSIRDVNGSKFGSPKAGKGEEVCKVQDVAAIASVEQKASDGPSVVKHVRLLFSDGSGQRRCRVSSLNIVLILLLPALWWENSTPRQ